MALKSPVMPASSFSPYSDSPHSPARFGQSFGAAGNTQSNRSSGPSDSLAPPPSPYPQQVEPSPVDSNGTEGTDIDEDTQEEGDMNSPGEETDGETGELLSPDVEITSPQSARSDNPPPKIDTQVAIRSQLDNEPQSVIHIPSGFKSFEARRANQKSPAPRSEETARVASPSTPEAAAITPPDKKDISYVNTNVPRYMERATPRAQTRPELDKESKGRSRTSSLEGLLPGFDQYFHQHLTERVDIPEALDKDGCEQAPEQAVRSPDTAELVGEGKMQQAMNTLNQADNEVSALKAALSECWTLCNTLAGLSSSHRQRTFKFQGRSEVQQQAWRSCWRLCQQLYDNRDADHKAYMTPTLEMCRDFCQSLFDARQKMDETTDSVLRVSFELNNHLYNTHDRSLPDAFNERTLEFYITLCHRLMKQRTSLPEETDALLRACWSLAEQLFNVRQNRRDDKPIDEDLLGSAVQACWELCDIFREGWTQVRPDRNTPRPSQLKFGSQTTSYRSNSSHSGGRSTASTISNRNYHDAQRDPPETPVTIFDDTSTAHSSPTDDVNVPNILVLGPASSASSSLFGGAPHHDRWTSTASVLSDYSESVASSQRSSSTATAGAEEAQLTRLRYLLLKAGINTGYSRTSGQSLPAFVKSLSDNAFGTLPWQMKVFNFYKKLILNDKSMLTAHQAPSRRLAASEVAKAVRWLGSSEQWAWMRDLFRIVFGFGIDEADRRGGSFQT